MPPKCKSSDAGNSDMPKKSHKSASFKWKRESSQQGKKKKEYAEVAKIWGKDKSSISEVGKKEKNT